MIGIIPGCAAFDQLLDLKKVDVIFCFLLFAGTSKHDAFVVVVYSLKQLAHLWERSHLWKIFFSEYVGSIVIQFFAETLDLIWAKKLGQILIGAFADLGA